MAACIALVAAALAACGSSSKSSSSSSAPAASSSTSASASATASASGTSASGTAPKGAPFVVGSICACSGPYAGDIGGDNDAIEAWASSVNAAGGINGHPVKVIAKDDSGDPTTSLQDVKQLVESDHVMAIVADMTTADASWTSYVASKGIPVVGGDGTESSFITSPDFFPSNTQLPATLVGSALQSKAAGFSHFGVAYCAEAPVCAEINPLASAAAASAGMKYSSVKISATAPSYAAPCLQMKADGVDAIYVADTPAVITKFFDGCAQQGYHPTLAVNLAPLTKVVLSDSNLEGALLVGGAANPFDSSTPAVAQMQSALQKYAGISTNALKYTDVMTWSGGKLFQAAATAGHLTPSSTPADVKTALYKLHNETLDGLAPPLNYTPGKPAFIPCYFTLKITGQQFVSQNNNKPTCLTAAQAKVAGG